MTTVKGKDCSVNTELNSPDAPGTFLEVDGLCLAAVIQSKVPMVGIYTNKRKLPLAITYTDGQMNLQITDSTGTVKILTWIELCKALGMTP